MSRLSKPAILRAIDEGRILILPFNGENLSNSQYDVRLGEFYYREQRYPGSSGFFNPFFEGDVERTWGVEPFHAERHFEWAERENSGALLRVGTKKEFSYLSEDELIIWIEPGETILAHTIEFIGGCDNTITTQMHARSSFGRSFIEVCKCAGLGDIGFHSRWTMEITNNSRNQKIPLIVGARIAQITFSQTEPIDERDSYAVKGGKYQSTAVDPTESWDPRMMLKPKLYLDREIGNGGFSRFRRPIQHSRQ